MDSKQRNAHIYLKDKYESQELFTKTEFNEFVGWGKNIGTYWSKKIKTLLVKQGKKYRVSEVFRRFISEANFHKHISQSSFLSTNYKTFSFNNLIIFDFFLPLSNELFLKDALDSLFYKDSIKRRLKSVDINTIKRNMGLSANLQPDKVYEKVTEIITDKFGGYSISHVNGRFRADILMSYNEVASKSKETGYQYLIDETTAVVRFIFPFGNQKEKLFLSSTKYFEELLGDEEDLIEGEAKKIRWLFYVLFVQSIIEIINGEDEIWMLESGFKNRLHIWRMEN